MIDRHKKDKDDDLYGSTAWKVAFSLIHYGWQHYLWQQRCRTKEPVFFIDKKSEENRKRKNDEDDDDTEEEEKHKEEIEETKKKKMKHEE